MNLQDWPVDYHELEPYYDKFEKVCGTSGKAGNLQGKKIDGGNIFEAPALQRVSESAAHRIAQHGVVRAGGAEAGLSPVSGASIECFASRT